MKARQVDNRLLIELEKFYQTASLLIGLGGLALNEEAFQAWRAYDHLALRGCEVSVTGLRTDGGFVVDASFVFIHRYSKEVWDMSLMHDFFHQIFSISTESWLLALFLI